MMQHECDVCGRFFYDLSAHKLSCYVGTKEPPVSVLELLFKIQESHAKQIDENIKISNRVDKIDLKIQCLTEKIIEDIKELREQIKILNEKLKDDRVIL
jgi:protein-arginine kinase activator protein McsA